MTRKEAVKHLSLDWYVSLGRKFVIRPGKLDDFLNALYFALTALCPVSRERVEKVWKGEWKRYLPPLGAGDVQCRCTRCGMTPDAETPFCAWCGAPMTDEAVEMVMERLEALNDL